MKHMIIAVALALGSMTDAVMAQERVEIDSIVIKGNKEFPQILYIVPWKDMKNKSEKEQTLVLHSLFGNLFDPVYELTGNGNQPPAFKK